jgi:hypothetical protein
MTVPERTAEQRAQALEAALAARRQRSELRTALKEGRITAAEVVRGAGDDPVWSGLRVRWLLECVPGIGTVRAERIMADLRIASSRRVQGLGEHQRSGLIAVLEARS